MKFFNEQKKKVYIFIFLQKFVYKNNVKKKKVSLGTSVPREARLRGGGSPGALRTLAGRDGEEEGGEQRGAAGRAVGGGLGGGAVEGGGEVRGEAGLTWRGEEQTISFNFNFN